MKEKDTHIDLCCQRVAINSRYPQILTHYGKDILFNDSLAHTDPYYLYPYI